MKVISKRTTLIPEEVEVNQTHSTSRGSLLAPFSLPMSHWLVDSALWMLLSNAINALIFYWKYLSLIYGNVSSSNSHNIVNLTDIKKYSPPQTCWETFSLTLTATLIRVSDDNKWFIEGAWRGKMCKWGWIYVWYWAILAQNNHVVEWTRGHPNETEFKTSRSAENTMSLWGKLSCVWIIDVSSSELHNRTMSTLWADMF